MNEEREFYMPQYYGDFKCKMGDCRSACCVGWAIKISLADYFRLEGEECSDDLKKRIDKGVRVLLHPTPDEYAEIVHDYDGNCPMRLADGKCLVHQELGENALAKVCKLYPRGIRVVPGYECSCANSCEAVVELLFSQTEPIKFVRKTLKVDELYSVPRKNEFATCGKEVEIRAKLISIIQDRRYPLSTRLKMLGLALEKLDEVLKNQDKIEKFLVSEFVASEEKVEENDVIFGLDVMKKLLELLNDRSVSVRKYGERALSYFSQGDIKDKYLAAKTEFENRFPRWEIWLENLLVNHLFFEQFPFQDRKENPLEEFIAVSSVYATLRFLGIGLVLFETTEEDFVDMVAAVFRLISHTGYDYYSAKTLMSLGVDTPKKIFSLIIL